MNTMNPFVGECLGTAVLMVFGLGVVANSLLTRSKGAHAGWLAITTGWAIAAMMGVFVAQSAGSAQADLNPAVSLAKYTLGIYDSATLLKVILSELLGAFIGASVVWLAYYPHWLATPDPAAKLAVFCTSPAIRHIPSNFLCELIGTFILVFGVGAIFGAATHGAPVTGLGPYLVGMLVWGLGLSLGGPTGYAINPARDLGSRLAHALLPIAGKGGSDWSYAWVPILGPLAGGYLGALAWKWAFLN